MRHLGKLRRRPALIPDNGRNSDTGPVTREMELFKEAGGDTVVEVSSRCLGQDALGLKQIAESSGVNIIAGCGYYKVAGHPPDMAKRSVEDVATNGALYHTPERYRVQHALVAIKHNHTIDRSLRHILPNDQSHMRPSAEVETLFADCPEAVEATLEISERCEFDFSSDLGYTLRSRAFMPEAHRNTHIEGTRLTVENAAYILAGHHSTCSTKTLNQCTGVIQYRIRHAHADVGPGDATHLREPIGQLSRQNLS